MKTKQGKEIKIKILPKTNVEISNAIEYDKQASIFQHFPL